MKLIERIKRDKSEIEKHRTISKIHLSFDARRKLVMDPSMADFDAKSSNLSDTFLACELVVHTDQGNEYWFEDVNGLEISASGDTQVR